MIKEIQSSFLDDFTLYARLMPVVVLVLPFGISAFVRGAFQQDLLEMTAFLLLMLGAGAFAMYILRNRGKSVQASMYNRLGAKPTTIIQRFSDQRVDEVTKRRYHKRLNEVYSLHLPECPENETPESDSQYESAANALRNYANSHRDKEPRVYQELKEYDFTRNLYGGKCYALIAYMVTAGRELWLLKPTDIGQLITGLDSDYAVLLIMVLAALALLLFVKKSDMEKRAFDYAKTLIEVSERINMDA